MSNLANMFSFFRYLLLLTTYLSERVESHSQPTSNVINIRNMYYYISQSTATWSGAFQECHAMGGHLVTPANPVLDNSMRLFMVGSEINEKVWAGGRVSGPDGENRREWKWETYDWPFSWTNFHSPACGVLKENSCLLAYNENGTWGWCGRPCTDNYHYICEFGTQPITTTESEITTDMVSSTTTYVSTVLTTSTSAPTTPLPGFECPLLYGSFADPKDCAKYYVCNHGVVIAHRRCPGDLLWNNIFKTCDYPWNVECSISSSTTPPTTSTSLESTTTKGTTDQPTSPPTDFICPAPDGQFSDPKDCARYYVCSHGIVIAHKRCPNGKLWNNTSKRCDETTHGT